MFHVEHSGRSDGVHAPRTGLAAVPGYAGWRPIRHGFLLPRTGAGERIPGQQVALLASAPRVEAGPQPAGKRGRDRAGGEMDNARVFHVEHSGYWNSMRVQRASLAPVTGCVGLW